jgi:hypothetical protein
MKYEYIVHYPNSATPVKSFKLMRDARAFSDSLVLAQMEQHRITIPCIKRKPVLKGNTNGQTRTTA